jgi:hypothetical protein
MTMQCWIPVSEADTMALSQTGDKCPQDSMPRTLWGFGLQLAPTPRHVLFLLLVLSQQQSGGDTSTCMQMQWLRSLRSSTGSQSSVAVGKKKCMQTGCTDAACMSSAPVTRQYNADRTLISGPCRSMTSFSCQNFWQNATVAFSLLFGN